MSKSSKKNSATRTEKWKRKRRPAPFFMIGLTFFSHFDSDILIEIGGKSKRMKIIQIASWMDSRI